jgi:hypothetical protein
MLDAQRPTSKWLCVVAMGSASASLALFGALAEMLFGRCDDNCVGNPTSARWRGAIASARGARATRKLTRMICPKPGVQGRLMNVRSDECDNESLQALTSAGTFFDKGNVRLRWFVNRADDCTCNRVFDYAANDPAAQNLGCQRHYGKVDHVHAGINQRCQDS